MAIISKSINISAIFLVTVVCLFGFALKGISADALLDEPTYIRSVLESSHQLKGMQNLLEATRVDQERTGLETATQFSTTVSHFDDHTPSTSVTPSYSGMGGENYRITLSKQFNFGTKAALHLDLDNTKLREFKASPQMTEGQTKSAANFSPSLELSQPLWQNGFGRAIRKREEMAELQTKAKDQEFAITRRIIIFQARQAYNRLAFARDRLAAALGTLASAQKILSYVQTQFDRNLAEESDLYQTQALKTARELEVAIAQTEVNSASIAFNDLRGIDGTTVAETLRSFRDLTPVEHSPQMDASKRSELKLAQAQVAVAESAVDLAVDSGRPILDLFGSYGLYQSKESASDAIQKVSDPNQPKSIVGIKFSMILDAHLAGRAAEAARLRHSAARNDYNAKSQQYEHELTTLLTRRRDAFARFALAKNLEETQQKKLTNEERQLRNGRSTTYQLLMFDQDLAQATLRRLEAAYEIATIDVSVAQFEEDGV